MSTTQEPESPLTRQILEEVEAYILDRLPQVLEEDPRFVTFIEGIVAEKFPRRDEFARLLDEVTQHRQETRVEFARVDQRLDKVDQRLDKVDQRLDDLDERVASLQTQLSAMEKRIYAALDDRHMELLKAIDRFGARWGIRNEEVFRKTIAALLTDTFGVAVEERHLGGEQFDLVIYNGHHILVEIAASVKRNILERLQRKRRLYAAETGIEPARFILAVGSIYSERAMALRAAGFEVIEPELDDDE